MRAPTGMKKDANVDSVGYNAQVNLQNRPATKGGIGIAPSSHGGGGPKRQIYDRTYYLNQIRKRNTVLHQEISKFKSEIEVINKDNSSYVGLEKQYDGLINEVRQLEGELADYNLAQDKFRAGTKPEDILALYNHIKAQNEHKKASLDELFIERKEMENEIADLEKQMIEIQQANEELLNELEPDKRQSYEKLKRENGELMNQVNYMRSELENVNQMLARADGQLRQDNLRQRAHHLKKEKVSLLSKKEELELQTNESNLPFPEARERLISRIKQDNAECL